MPPPCVLGEANVGLKLSSLNMIECCLKRFLLRCSKPFLTAIIPNAQWCFIWFDNNMRLNVCTFLWIYKTEKGYNLLFPNEALVMVWPVTKQVEFSFPFYCISCEISNSISHALHLQIQFALFSAHNRHREILPRQCTFLHCPINNV